MGFTEPFLIDRIASISPGEPALESTHFICIQVLKTVPMSSEFKELIGRIVNCLTIIHQMQERTMGRMRSRRLSNVCKIAAALERFAGWQQQKGNSGSMPCGF
jgi:hypothetical protein